MLFLNSPHNHTTHEPGLEVVSSQKLRGHLVSFVLMQEMHRDYFVYVCLFMLCLIAL